MFQFSEASTIDQVSANQNMVAFCGSLNLLRLDLPDLSMLHLLQCINIHVYIELGKLI